ncbi:CbxX/CfqX family protein, partial [Kipferlia bialata]
SPPSKGGVSKPFWSFLRDGSENDSDRVQLLKQRMSNIRRLKQSLSRPSSSLTDLAHTLGSASGVSRGARVYLRNELRQPIFQVPLVGAVAFGSDRELEYKSMPSSLRSALPHIVSGSFVELHRSLEAVGGDTTMGKLLEAMVVVLSGEGDETEDALAQWNAVSRLPLSSQCHPVVWTAVLWRVAGMAMSSFLQGAIKARRLPHGLRNALWLDVYASGLCAQLLSSRFPDQYQQGLLSGTQETEALLALSTQACEELRPGKALSAPATPKAKPNPDQLNRLEWHHMWSAVCDNILQHLVAEMENKIGKLVVVFAGYKQDIEKTLESISISYKQDIEKTLEKNQGLASRFNYNFLFEDYTDPQLLSILQGCIKAKSKISKGTFRMADIDEDGESKSARIAIRRIGCRRGSKGFGNARTVHKLVDTTLMRQRNRLMASNGSEDNFAITRDDILGKRVDDVIGQSKAYQQLQGMIGLKKVKKEVDALINLVRANAEREDKEEPYLDIALNRLFLGNPGTGKTTAAKLYGAILSDIGLLSKSEPPRLVKRADLVGDVVGGTATKTQDAIKAAQGGVLMIDEAYALLDVAQGTNDIYGKECIDTLVGEIDNKPGADICVIMAGYRDPMSAMFQKANEGLKSRFSFESAFEFEDFTDEELAKILAQKLRSSHIKSSLDTRMYAIKLLGQQRQQPSFGNARAVMNMVSTATVAAQKRLGLNTGGGITLIKEDFDSTETDEAVTQDPMVLFQDILGCQSLREQLKKLKNKIKWQRKMGQKVDVATTFRFVGNPGTGKTTVAKRMGMFFHALGVLATNEIKVTTAKDFEAPYVGQSAKKTTDLFDEALGKVLFIDEAYALNPKNSHFMKDVVNCMVDLLTREKYKGNMVVILAGYENDIVDLMTANPGLASRFPTTVSFTDLTAEEASTMLLAKLREEGGGDGLIVTDDVPPALPILFQAVIDADPESWSNGRDVVNIVAQLTDSLAGRLFDSAGFCGAGGDDDMRTLVLADFEGVFDRQCEERVKTARIKMANSRAQTPNIMMDPRYQTQDAPALEAPRVATRQQTKEAEAEPEVEEEPEQEEECECCHHDGPQREGGVSEEEYQQIQLERRLQEEQWAERRAEEERLEAQRQRLIEEERKRVEAERLARLAFEKAERERKAREEAERLALEAKLAEELRQRQEAERKRREAIERRRRLEEERRRLAAEAAIRAAQARQRELQRAREQEERNQQKLRDMGVCCAGFRWICQGGTRYRCSAGGHTVTL